MQEITADVNPPKPIAPSLNSNPKYYLGRPSSYVDVIESPADLITVKISVTF